MTVSITIAATVNAAVARAWTCWTEPAHIVQWNAASADWHTPRATNDLRVGGRFTSRMEARDGSMGFDFGGTYTVVEMHRRIEYAMDDGRRVSVTFEEAGGKTKVTETFDAEEENPPEMQRAGWQSILDNFRAHVEARG